MNELNPSYYAIIPSEVRYDKDLNPNAKLLYGEITALCNKEGYCWATNKYFAELYGVTTVTISRWLKDLIDKNYVYSKMYHQEGSRKIQQRRIYLSHIIYNQIDTLNKSVNTPLNKSVNTPLNKNDKGTLNKNVKDNNTSINNTSINNTNNIYIDNSKEKESQITEEEKKIQSIYEEWKKANIINHRRITRAMKTKIKSALKDYTEEEIKQSIRNYSYIVNNDNYFFSHRWTLDQFCTITQKDRIGNFLDLEVAKNNYRANKGDIGNGGNEGHNIKNENDSRREHEEFEAEYFEKWNF